MPCGTGWSGPLTTRSRSVTTSCRESLGEFGERWQLGLDSLLGGQRDIADRLDACVAAYASTDRTAAAAYVAAMTSPP